MLVALLCPTVCDPMDCSLPGFSTHGILQARILDWVAIPFSRGSSWPRDWALVSCIAAWFFTIWATREAWDFFYLHSNIDYTKNRESEFQPSVALQNFKCTHTLTGLPCQPTRRESLLLYTVIHQHVSSFACSCLMLGEDYGVECHHRGILTVWDRNAGNLKPSCFYWVHSVYY